MKTPTTLASPALLWRVDAAPVYFLALLGLLGLLGRSFPGEDAAIDDGIGEDATLWDGLGEDAAIEDGIGEDGIGEDGIGEDGIGEDDTIGDELGADAAIDDGTREDATIWDGLREDAAIEDGIGEDATIGDGLGEDAAIVDGIGEDAAIGTRSVGGTVVVVVDVGPGTLPPPTGLLLAQTVQGIVKVAVMGVSPQIVHTVEVVVKPGGTTVGLGGIGTPEPVEVMV
ncbi:MAG: hypothetical protein LQ347_004923 [Umbilicaria vellea]|nr:MAG: hypothetical protein LQ347_004923 [Umbilicaria vellea]